MPAPLVFAPMNSKTDTCIPFIPTRRSEGASWAPQRVWGEPQPKKFLSRPNIRARSYTVLVHILNTNCDLLLGGQKACNITIIIWNILTITLPLPRQNMPHRFCANSTTGPKSQSEKGAASRALRGCIRWRLIMWLLNIKYSFFLELSLKSSLSFIFERLDVVKLNRICEQQLKTFIYAVQFNAWPSPPGDPGKKNIEHQCP